MRAFFLVMTAISVVVFAAAAHAGKKQLQIEVNKEDVDLVNRTLFFKINRPTDSAEIRIYSPDGKLLAEKVELYNGALANTKLAITWPPLLGNEENFRIDLKVTDVDEFWIGWEVVRFYLEVPHEDVVFETAKWEIRPSEFKKLDTALKILMENVEKYGKLMECRLYVGGYTDTVGGISDNRELSRKRADAIAKYFQANGLKGIQIFVRGFGEENLAVQTGDNIDNERNRRAQYILATFAPEIPGPGSWKRIQ